jgi:autonomous glycyl radical cofactor GrcA
LPTGPKGQKRPADVIGNAVKVMRIATGEEAVSAEPENPAVVLGRRGGAARAKKLTPEQRREIAKKGAASRWSKPE